MSFDMKSDLNGKVIVEFLNLQMKEGTLIVIKRF